MGNLKIGGGSSYTPPTPKTQPASPSKSVQPTPATPATAPSAPVSASEKTLGPRPSYAPPQPPSKAPDLSSPQARSAELASIQNPQAVTRSVTQLARIQASKPSQEVKNAGHLVDAMHDPKFGKILEKFSPSMGQRFLQACGKSEGSVDGGRFKKNVARMLPLVNICVYGKDAVRAHKNKEALNGIARHAERTGNSLALQIAQSLGAHEKSKRNTQAISGAVSVATTAVAFVPGTQIAPALTGASSSLASGVGAQIGAMGVRYTAAAAIDSGIKTAGSSLFSTASSTAQDYAVTGVDRSGASVGKEKIGSGYGKLKVTTRQDAHGQVKMETEMGYQAARALVNYLGPAQGMAESPASPRMMLRRSLGANDDNKTYSVSDDKKFQRSLATQLDAQEGQTDYLQMFYNIGVKGADMPYSA